MRRAKPNHAAQPAAEASHANHVQTVNRQTTYMTHRGLNMEVYVDGQSLRFQGDPGLFELYVCTMYNYCIVDLFKIHSRTI